MFSFAIFWTMSIPYYIRYFFLPQPLPSLSGFMWVAGCAGVLGVLCGLPVRLCQQWLLPAAYRPVLRRLWLNLLGWIAVCAVLAVLGSQRELEIYAALAAAHEIPGYTTPHPGMDWVFTALLILFIADTLFSAVVLWRYRAAQPFIRH